MAQGCDCTRDTTKLCLGLLSGTRSSSWMSCHGRVDVPRLAGHAGMGVQGCTCCRPDTGLPQKVGGRTIGGATGGPEVSSKGKPQRYSSKGKWPQTHRHWLLWGQGREEPSQCKAATTSEPLLPFCGAEGGSIDPRPYPTSALLWQQQLCSTFSLSALLRSPEEIQC